MERKRERERKRNTKINSWGKWQLAEANSASWVVYYSLKKDLHLLAVMWASEGKLLFSRKAKQYKMKSQFWKYLFLGMVMYVGCLWYSKWLVTCTNRNPTHSGLEDETSMVFGCLLNKCLCETPNSWKSPLKGLSLFHQWIHITFFKSLLSLLSEISKILWNSFWPALRLLETSTNCILRDVKLTWALKS